VSLVANHSFGQHLWIPASAGMTSPNYPDIRPHDISHSQYSPLHELHALHGSGFYQTRPHHPHIPARPPPVPAPAVVKP